MKYERLTDKKWKEIEKHCYAKGLYSVISLPKKKRMK